MNYTTLQSLCLKLSSLPAMFGQQMPLVTFLSECMTRRSASIGNFFFCKGKWNFKTLVSESPSNRKVCPTTSSIWITVISLTYKCQTVCGWLWLFIRSFHNSISREFCKLRQKEPPKLNKKGNENTRYVHFMREAHLWQPVWAAEIWIWCFKFLNGYIRIASSANTSCMFGDNVMVT